MKEVRVIFKIRRIWLKEGGTIVVNAGDIFLARKEAYCWVFTLPGFGLARCGARAARPLSALEQLAEVVE